MSVCFGCGLLVGTLLLAEDNSQGVGSSTANSHRSWGEGIQAAPSRHMIPGHCLPKSSSVHSALQPQEPEFNSGLTSVTSTFPLPLASFEWSTGLREVSLGNGVTPEKLCRSQMFALESIQHLLWYGIFHWQGRLILISAWVVCTGMSKKHL